MNQETRDKNAIMLVLAHIDRPIAFGDPPRNFHFDERVRVALALQPLLEAVRQGKDPLDWVTDEHPGRLNETAPTEGTAWPSST